MVSEDKSNERKKVMKEKSRKFSKRPGRRNVLRLLEYPVINHIGKEYEKEVVSV